MVDPRPFQGPPVTVRMHPLSKGDIFLIGLEFYLGTKGERSTHPMMKLIAFIITEIYPDGIEEQQADKIWIEVQNMHQW